MLAILSASPVPEAKPEPQIILAPAPAAISWSHVVPAPLVVGPHWILPGGVIVPPEVVQVAK